MIALANIQQHVAAGKLRLVDVAPTGDDLLDATLRAMARIGARTDQDLDPTTLHRLEAPR
jgi:hypothetical protein